MSRIGKAFKAFFICLRRGEDAIKIREEVIKKVGQGDLAQRADCVDMLYQLQDKARFVDFIMEDITALDDAQVGAAVRNIHKDCRTMLEGYFTFSPVVETPEGETFIIEEGYDPYSIKPMGDLSGDAPWTGEVYHPGWKVEEVKIPLRADDASPDIVAPAEIEIG